METLKQIKKGLLQGVGIVVVLGLAGTVYAFTSPLPQVSSGDDLTAQKWNDMVDAVNDEYSTSEVMTNKIWMGKPVYRKVVNVTDLTPSTNTRYQNHNISNIDKIIGIEHIGKRPNGNVFENSRYETLDSIGLFYATSTDVHYYYNNAAGNLEYLYITLEYTKN